MLSITRAALRFIGEERPRSALPSSGAISANVAESTVFTKVVSSNAFKVFSVSSGFAMTLTSCGTRSLTSSFVIDLHAYIKKWVALQQD